MKCCIHFNGRRSRLRTLVNALDERRCEDEFCEGDALMPPTRRRCKDFRSIRQRRVGRLARALYGLNWSWPRQCAGGTLISVCGFAPILRPTSAIHDGPSRLIKSAMDSGRYPGPHRPPKNGEAPMRLPPTGHPRRRRCSTKSPLLICESYHNHDLSCSTLSRGNVRCVKLFAKPAQSAQDSVRKYDHCSRMVDWDIRRRRLPVMLWELT